MQFKESILLLAATFVLRAAANDIAIRMPQPDLSLRHPLAIGGWSLATNGSDASNTTCPADAPACGATWCCPSSLTCVKTAGAAEAEVCCDSQYTDNEPQCIQDFGHIANTSCADSSWTLWNATQAGYPINFFCCLPGEIGTQEGYCVAPTALDGATPAASIAGTAPATSTATGTSSGSSSSPTKNSQGSGIRILEALLLAQVLVAGFVIGLL